MSLQSQGVAINCGLLIFLFVPVFILIQTLYSISRFIFLDLWADINNVYIYKDMKI